MALIIHVNVNGISTVCVFQEFDQSLELDTFLVYYFLVPKLGAVPIKMWNAVSVQFKSNKFYSQFFKC